MSGVNKVILVGRLGNDPEVIFLNSGSQVANFSIATSESWRDKNTGEKREKTEWHRIECFNRLAEIAGQYLVKGSLVYIEGKITTQKFQDQNTGQDRYITKINVLSLQMLGSPGNQNNAGNQNNNHGGQGNYNNYGGGYQGNQQPQQRQQPQNNNGYPQENSGGYNGQQTNQQYKQPPQRRQQAAQQQQPQQQPQQNNNQSGFDNFEDDIPF